jgi:membrane glycosyltransferase
MPLSDAGVLTYRRRCENIGRKPGNIADWLARWGDDHDYMLVLDADSRMSTDRIRRLIARMEARPRLGLLQAAIALTPGRTRFGRHQRMAAKLLGPTFVRGFAAWTGRSSNYWGHNAIIRVEAFRVAANLPILSGRPPFGGSVLSHDFVEAAWMRRAGWHVELDVAQGGSAEGAPQTLEEFHKRDRRWCQGNLQHMRLLAEPALHPISRWHMLSGGHQLLRSADLAGTACDEHVPVVLRARARPRRSRRAPAPHAEAVRTDREPWPVHDAVATQGHPARIGG